MSVPVRFPGSTVERERNIASHFWVDDEDSGMCILSVPIVSFSAKALEASTSITVEGVGLADPEDRWLIESWLHWKFRLWRTNE